MSETTIVAVDLAYKGYNDFGIAILSVAGNSIDVEVVKPQHIDLIGPPSASDLAIKLKQLCNERESRVLILDGPQAWKDASNGLEHCRLCERQLNTPAKTGLPYYVKPRNYEPFVRFSIEVFNKLQKRDIRLLQGENDYPADKEVLALESFPLAAWKTLKINPLPAKSKANAHDITDRLRILKCLYQLNISDIPTHDELQAIVMGVAGIAFLRRDTAGYQLFGNPPIEIDGIKREGFIIVPTNG